MSSKGGIMGLMMAMCLAGLRRKTIGIAALLLVMPNLASATSQMNESTLRDDGKPKNIVKHVDVRYGPMTFNSAAINSVFTVNNHQALLLDTGVSFRHILDISAGVGFVQEMGWLVAADGSASDEHDMLTIIPANISATLRADFFDGQLLVPFGSAGLNYWLWRENWVESDNEVITSGGKPGYHYSFGGQLLLDGFDESAASQLFIKYGIEDTYFSVEHRIVNFDDEGLSFDSSMTTFGLRFHY